MNTDHFISSYQKRLHLQNAVFSLIDHEDASVATVYKVTQPDGKDFVLKICTNANHYAREVYFLKYFASLLPVPRITHLIEPEKDIYGAILMEYLPGTLLSAVDFTDAIAYEMGLLLAHIHTHRLAGYGDLINPQDLTSDPRIHFTLKFEEGLEECSSHLPQTLLKQCRLYYSAHVHLLDSVDGPCIIHRDFRPGNIIVYDGKIRGVIDWSSGRAGFTEDDFCSMEHGDSLSNPTVNESFLSGYASVRKVPDYSAVMPFLRLSRAIAIIGFTVKSGTWSTTSSRLYQFNRDFLETFF